MPSGFIPKEKLSAYERWELAAFDEGEGHGGFVMPGSETPEPEPEASEIIEEVPIVLPTAEDVERIHNEAYATGLEAGRAAGHAEGLEAGHAEGMQTGLAEAAAEAARIAAIVGNLQQSLQQVDQEIAEQLLGVAVEIASQVLRQSLRIKPELLLPVVREAIAALPLHHGHPGLYLNPADAAIVRTHLGEQLGHSGWRILEDSSITPGGCRIDCGASDIDASLETRWRRVLEAIGTSGEWLEPGS